MNNNSPLPWTPTPPPADDLPLVDAGKLAAQLGASEHAPVRTLAVEAVAQTGSTNVDLMLRLSSLAHPLLRVADRQSAGRGRAGRPWRSDPAATLTFSLAWRFERPLHALLGLPLAVGVALVEALQVFGIQAQLKWPNDVLRDGAKLAGILIETAADVAQPQVTWAVVGIGLNLDVPPGLEQELDRSIGAAHELRRQPRETVLAVIASALASALDEFERGGLAAFMARWQACHAYVGQAVRIIDHGTVVQEGVAAGIDAVGRLLIDTQQGRVAVMAGDVSLRLAQ
ncbi:biotin--[acetyl-CoA-carboxylase] ligase [Herbaspirillum sp. alder98]|uniref:biotin--[acetyl-CoA-carboxylase] ligase n=1 Tax=Herbaspirillum sp. alder98 TaxID=2913096 RepID=UPI001CD86548|nr:biotin--[acetyl-CoA-carboxylase] ligase [Herbaspirillum sp. alder98]MCA1326144.1 biotin--[acetyl-CoA-carboxylase] ligase [Herbaspirillum sp. alder98]